MAKSEEQQDFNDVIKLQFESDAEEIVVYNIEEKPKILEKKPKVQVEKSNSDPLLSLVPIVYTTKLDDMNALKTNLKFVQPNAILKQIYKESKPNIREKNIKSSSNLENIDAYIKVTSFITGINAKTRVQQTSQTLKQSVEQELNLQNLPVLKFATSLEDTNTQYSENSKIPVEENTYTYKKNETRKKRKRASRILYESSSDEDYDPFLSKSKKKKALNIMKVNIPKRNSDGPTKISIGPFKEKSDSKSDKSVLPKKKYSTSVVRKGSPVSSNIPNSSNMTTIQVDQTIPEKYTLVILVNQYKEASVYRINFLKLITDFYVIKDCDEYKLAEMYPKEDKITELYCCWFKREEIVGKICTRKNYTFTIQKILKQSHSCNPSEVGAEKCQCCCYVSPEKFQSQNAKLGRKSLIDKAITDADDWIRKSLNNCASNGLVDKALNYVPKANRKKLTENPSEKYLENYLLCLKCCVSVPYYELYDIGKNGNVDSSRLQLQGSEIILIRKLLQRNRPIRDAQICCWFRREKLLQELKELKTSPATLKCVQKPHSCSEKKCSCCCKPHPLTLGIDIFPSIMKQTTTYEKSRRPISIEFNAKSKNAVLKSRYKKMLDDAGTTNYNTAAIVLSDYAFKNDNPLLSITILDKFKTLHLGSDNDGKLEVLLDETAKNLSIEELKTLSDILALATKEMVKLNMSPEEFCKRINTKSGDVIRERTSVPPIMTVKPTTPLDIDMHDNDLKDNQTPHTAKSTGPRNLKLIGQSQYVGQRQYTNKSKTKTTVSILDIYKSLSNVVETKNHGYIKSCKSYFDTIKFPKFVLPQTHTLKPSAMPIIKEIYTLTTTEKEKSIVPSKSSCETLNKVMNFEESSQELNTCVNKLLQETDEYQSSDTNKTINKHNLKSIDNMDMENKLRIKSESELNAPLSNSLDTPADSNTRKSNLPRVSSADIVCEPQFKIPKVVIEPCDNGYFIADKITPSPKVISIPASVSQQLNGNYIQSSIITTAGAQNIQPAIVVPTTVAGFSNYTILSMVTEKPVPLWNVVPVTNKNNN